MPSLLTVLLAKTTGSNSPESDLISEVLHDVKVRNDEGKVETVRLLAVDPLEARERVLKMNISQYNSLPRVN